MVWLMQEADRLEASGNVEEADRVCNSRVEKQLLLVSSIIFIDFKDGHCLPLCMVCSLVGLAHNDSNAGCPLLVGEGLADF